MQVLDNNPCNSLCCRFLEGELEHLESENKSLESQFRKEEAAKKELRYCIVHTCTHTNTLILQT